MKIKCAWCGKSFKRDMMFVRRNKKRGSKNLCGKSCAGKYAASLRQGVGKSYVMLQCPACGTVFEKLLKDYTQTLKRNANRTCCSQVCAAQYRSGKQYEGKLMEPRLIGNAKL